jgi:hypothetical protein
MPAIANVTLENTFDEFRKVVNQLVVSVNDSDASPNLINVKSNTISISISESVAKKGILYIDTNLSSTISNTSVNVIASAASVNLVNQLRIAGESNTRNTAGIFANSSNAYAATLSIATGSAANTYAYAQMQSVRNQAGAMANAANSTANSQIAAIDISAVAVLKSAGANNYMNSGLSVPAQGLLIRKQNNAYEGGELLLERPTNTLLYGNVTIDIFTNSIRFVENGGTARGISANLAGAAAGAGSELIHSTNINQYNAKNILDYPLNQSVSITASPTFMDCNANTSTVTTWFKKSGSVMGGLYDAYNQGGLYMDSATFLRTGNPDGNPALGTQPPWGTKQVGLKVEGDLWFNSGYGAIAARAFGVRAWATYTPGISTTTNYNINVTSTTNTSDGRGGISAVTAYCTLTTTTCAAAGLVTGSSVVLNSAIYYFVGDWVVVPAGTYTITVTGASTFIFSAAPGPYASYGMYPATQAKTIGVTQVSARTLYSGGISSITDLGSNMFDVSFSTPMPDSNYAVIMSAGGPAPAAAKTVLAPYAGIKNTNGFRYYSSAATSSQESTSFIVIR